ncbi:MAG: hypothetical protein HY529_02395 [Chloroflexi bacterium]|nr:hypothetical protein [Chloroflexota bacterium]
MVLAVKKEERASAVRQAARDIPPREAVVFCPHCKALQTVWISGSELLPTRKFNQVGNDIYHDCGSSQPCRLYWAW